MTDLAAAIADERQNGEVVSVKLAVVKVFKGAILTFNSAGYADVGDASEALAGIAIETVDNSAGSAGALSVRVFRTGVVELGCGSTTQASVGKEAFVTDDATVHFTAGVGLIPIGVVVGLTSATKVRVDLNRTANAAQ